MADTIQDSIDMTNISIPEFPIQIDFGDWVKMHPDCDSIMEMIGTGPIMLVYAYATSKAGNKALNQLKKQKYADKKILMGVSKDGISRLV